MSQINKNIVLGVLLLIGLLLALGCGSSTPNDKVIYNGESETHSEGWVPAGHMAAAQKDENTCTECHGSDFSGGLSGVSCSECHLGGTNSIHPLVWSQYTGTIHATYVKDNGNTKCANAACHGTDLGGVELSGPSCSSCHMGGPDSVHPLDWSAAGALVTKHGEYVKSVSSYASCATKYCHGVKLEGVAGSGHSCATCHQ